MGNSKANFRLVEKAYSLNFSKISEGYLYDEDSGFTIIAKRRGVAKSILSSKADWEDLYLLNGNKITYLNVPVVRAKAHDLVSFNGTTCARYVAERYAFIEKRRETLKASEEGWYYIIKRGAYYRPGNAGYTEDKCQAGVYWYKEAILEAIGCEDIFIQKINEQEHNAAIEKRIEALKRNLINGSKALSV